MKNCFKTTLVCGFGLTIAASGLVSGRALAQVTPDRTLGAESSVVNPNVIIQGLPSDRIEGGARRGANLFHSFVDFNVASQRGVYFANPAGVGNIFSRVTGSNVSNIAGRLGVLGGANLFLLNPNGIIFGPNASLDVAGSFMASTARDLLMADGTVYSATNPTAASLLTVSVPLGVQFGKDQPRAIVNSGNLTTGNSLALIGGTVVSTGQLNAPTGNLVVATAPAESAVNLSPTGQLLSITTPSTTAPLTPSSASLVPLAQENAASGLTLNGTGQVALTGSGLPVVEGDVVVRQLTGQTATLAASHNLTLVESQLQTAGNLNLLAGNTVWVRDSVANPFVASVGGQLLVQGNQAVDIFALNNATSGLFSGGNIVLRSASTVGGDAHYYAGGSFQIETLDGSAGNLFSPLDPIILASGNVSLGNYEGGSLHILAGGSVTLGNVKITGVDNRPDINKPSDPISNPPDNLNVTTINPDNPSSFSGTQTIGDLAAVTLSNGETLTIDGRNNSTLDVRAGVDWKQLGGLPVSPLTFGFINPAPTYPPDSVGIAPSADITISSIVNRNNNGQILLTNQFKKDERLNNGSIKVTSSIIGDPIDNSSISAYRTSVEIDSRGDVQVAKGIVTGTSGARGGDIIILSGGKVDVTGEGNVNGNIGSLLSLTDKNSGSITIKASGNIDTGSIDTEVIGTTIGSAGNVFLTSTNGQIDTTKGDITSKTPQGKSGDVTLTAKENIYTRSVTASNKSDSGGGFSTISVTSTDGSVFINKSQDGSVVLNDKLLDGTNSVKLSTTNEGSGISGLIFINAGEGKKIEIANSDIFSKGFYGEINIGLIDLRYNDLKEQKTPNQVIVEKSTVNAETIKGVSSKIDTPSLIQIRAREVDVNNSNITTTTNSKVQPGFITLDAEDSVFIRGGSQITSTISPDSGLSSSGFTPAITILGNSIQISNPPLLDTNNLKIDASTAGVGKGADVILIARDGGKIAIDNYQIQTNGISPAGGGKIRIYGGSLSLNNGSTVRADDQTLIGGKAGEIQIGALTSQEIENIKTQLRANIDVTQPTTDFGSPFSLQTLKANNSNISTSTKSGQAGTISVDASQSMSLTDRTSLLAQATSGGTAGDIRVVTPKLTVEKGSTISVNGCGNASSCTGRAGNLFIFSDQVVLNQGTLSAQTGQKQEVSGANIFLLGKEAANNDPTSSLLQAVTSNKSPQEINAQLGSGTIPPLSFLIMENGSKITATADPQSSASGGNIFIKTQVLLAPRTRNKIEANAGKGNGGNIYIFAKPLGIYNIEFRSTGTTTLNDITATSLSGRSGIVDITLPDINPARGLNQLSIDLADASKKITPICPIAGQQGASNQFVVSGRGGLPETPASTLSSNVLVGEQATVATQPNATQPNATSNSTANATEAPSGIEAQGVELGANGDFILTAHASSVDPHPSWQPFQRCLQPSSNE